jgi:hypothetical protein
MTFLFQSSRCVLALELVAAVASSGTTQIPQPTAGIIGRIVDQQSQAPVGGARVALLGTPRRTGSDSAGRFTEAGLVAGTYLLEVRAIGYGVTSWVVRLGESEVLDQVFELTPLGFDLDPVTVEGRPTFAQRRLQEFEQRRRSGRGVFITAAQIEASNASSIADVLRDIPGVLVVCRGGGCAVQMTRTARGTCRPDWIVDGFPATQSATPHLPTVGITGVEIYRSASETPTEFLKADSECGVIILWTKSGP